MIRSIREPNFTFHNVSINTAGTIKTGQNDPALHSTMFLLIQETKETRTQTAKTFTFHNVSINTHVSLCQRHAHNPLHSTMFLLIRKYARLRHILYNFTFHNVSINTDISRSRSRTSSDFTFHNVSINTRAVYVQG